MTNAILIHGRNTKEEFFDPDKPTASNDHWFPWLTKQLMLRGYKVDVPEMTQYDFTIYESWKREVERFDITPETVLVGHSCGGGFILRYLSESDRTVGKVVLVAPWLGITFGEPFDKNFFNVRLDRHVVQKTAGITVMSSDDDFDVIHQSIDRIRNEVDNIEYKEFSGNGHFTRKSLGTNAFPELLQELVDDRE